VGLADGSPHDLHDLLHYIPVCHIRECWLAVHECTSRLLHDDESRLQRDVREVRPVSRKPLNSPIRHR
jgi:hypothetical protein